MQESVWQGKPWEAFKTFAIIFSFVTNIILIIVLLLLAPHILPTINSVAKPLVGGLTNSFEQMGEARIVRTVSVKDQIPVQFTLPVQRNTSVVLTEPVPLNVPATFVLPAGGGTINGNVSLTLPPNVSLPIYLDIEVPVDTSVPVDLEVAVDIPLRETELGAPFTTLEGLFIPLDDFMQRLPADNDELFNRFNTQLEQELNGAAIGATSD